MANEGLKPVACLLLLLNLCMNVIVAAIGGWAINYAINNGFFIGSGLSLPAHFSPIYFPMGNAATGFFVIFAVIAGVVGAAAALAGIKHLREWTQESLPAAASSGFMAWALNVVAMGEGDREKGTGKPHSSRLAIKEIDLRGRNARLKTMEAFTIILSATQLFYLFAIQGGR